MKKDYNIKKMPYGKTVKDWIGNTPILVVKDNGTLVFDYPVFKALAMASGLKTKSHRAIKKRVKKIIVCAINNFIKQEETNNEKES